jgi:glyoxylase-like metal-dependent hydrolase (beta-lactamase superfamily II)
MFKKLWLAAALAVAGLAWMASAQGPAQKVIDDALRAMGAANVKTLVLYGEGGDGFVGQQRNPTGDYWRWYHNVYVVRSYDFEAQGFRTKRTRWEGANPPGGGAGTTTPAPIQNQDLVAMAAGNFNNQIEMAMTPIGFLHMARANNATVSTKTEKGKRWTVLSYPITGGQGKQTYPTSVQGYIDNQNRVQRVEVLVNQDFLGDVKWEATFSDWKDFDGVKFPTKIVQRLWDPKIFELTVHNLKTNVPVDLTPPAAKGVPGGGAGAAKGGAGAAKGGGAPAAPLPSSEDLGNGAWLYVNPYTSIIVEFKDYVMIVEMSQNDAYAEGLLAEARRLVPNKPVRYVISSHFHFDHTGGLRAAVAEGITIVTHERNKGLFERVMAQPHTLVPDKLERMNPRPKVKVEYVGEKHVFTDGAQIVETHALRGSTHSEGMLIVYLPRQKVLYNADEFNVNAQAPTAPVPNPNGYQVNLLFEVERLGLQVDRHIPAHLPNGNRKVTHQELVYMAGREQ